MYRAICLFICICITHISQTFAGGFIVVMPDRHQNPNLPQHSIRQALFPLETVSTQVQVSIDELTATTSIKQVFYNPSARQLEGYFLFPVPKDVLISQFSMDINGVPHHAELLDAQKAKKIYEEIVRKSKDPALLEFYGKKMFRVRIFPILPKKEQRIELSYTETLQKDNKTVAYTFPMNTEKYAAKTMQNISFKVALKTTDKLKTIYCPTHQVEIIRKGTQEATVGYEAKTAAGNRDFKLYFSTHQSTIGLSFLSYKEQQEDGYFLINLSPGLDEKQDIIAKDIVFVVDKSGSMAGEKLKQAKKALTFCVENLNKEDRFEIIPFSTEAQRLFGQVSSINSKTKKEALAFIEDIQAIGGTNIEEALQMALDSRKENSDRPLSIIFLTDGRPTIGLTQETALLEKINGLNQQNTRIFTFGIGTNLNTHLLDKLTQNSNAYRSYVLPDEDIEIKVSDFYTKVAAPVMTNISVEFDKALKVYDVYDKQLPDLFRGGSLSLMGRFKGSGQHTVCVKGYMNGQLKKYHYTLDLQDRQSQNTFIPNLWASRAVGYLLDQIRLHGSNQELIDEVTRLAKKHGIITPYTSFLILEDEAIAAQNGQNRSQVLRPRIQNAPRLFEDIDFEDEVANVSGTKSGGVRKKSGRTSVEISKEYQALNKAENLSSIQQGQQRMSYKDNTGQSKSLSDDIVHINGRALYKNNNQWTDANVALVNNKQLKINRIKFDSDAYYNLLKEPEAVAFLNLGRNVRFEMQHQIYEIYE